MPDTPKKQLTFTSMLGMATNPVSRSLTLTCEEALTSQVFEIQFGSAACEAVFAALLLFHQQHGPFVVDEPTPPTGSKH
jgi:hypothetical protein